MVILQSPFPALEHPHAHPQLSRGVGRNFRKRGQLVHRAKRAARFSEGTPIWGRGHAIFRRFDQLKINIFTVNLTSFI